MCFHEGHMGSLWNHLDGELKQCWVWFFLRSVPVHVHQGLELSQCSSRSDWWQLWSHTLDPSDMPHLTWSTWHFGQGPLVGPVSWGRGLEWLVGPWLKVLDPLPSTPWHLLTCCSLMRREGTMKSTEIWGDLFLGSSNQPYSCFKLNLKARFCYCSQQ